MKAALQATARFEGGFAVLMAVYGKDDPELFGRALASALANTLTPDEFILVVDGPVSPSLDEVIQRFESTAGIRFCVVRLAVNVGLARALNAGLAEVRCDWIARADADDINLPHRFESLARVARSALAPDVLGSAIREVERSGKVLAIRRPPLLHSQILAQLPRRNPLNHMSVAYRTGAIRAVGGYPDISLKEDYALWCHMARGGYRFANLHEVLVLATAGIDMYRRRGGWRYIQSEFEMQSTMVHLGIKGWLAATLDGMLRSFVFALPSALRGLIYRRLLRVPGGE